MPPVTDGLSLTFGSTMGDSIEFVLETPSEAVPPSFIQGPVNLTLLGELFKTEHRSGIEPLALANFRDDLKSILANDGTVLFGDHDYGLAVTLIRTRETFQLLLDWPMADLWELRLAQPSALDIQGWIGVVDAAETRFGPLVDHCDCGLPGHWYKSTTK
jgi:hypothetical protein